MKIESLKSGKLTLKVTVSIQQHKIDMQMRRKSQVNYPISGPIDGQNEECRVDWNILQDGNVVESLQELQQRRKGRAAVHRHRRQRVTILVINLRGLVTNTMSKGH